MPGKTKAPKVLDNITIENAKLMYRNFSGKEGQMNPAGRRNFCVVIPPEIAEKLVVDGWNIKYREPRDPSDDRLPYLQVSVSFAHFAPNIILISSKNKTRVDEKNLNILDFAEISQADIIIRPYNWEVQNKSGVKAYLKTMYITLVEDEFADKYRDIPDAAADFDDVA
jgi:hypothetical protein